MVSSNMNSTLQPRSSYIKTTIRSGESSNLGSSVAAAKQDERDQLVISKDHAVPSQLLRINNGLAPRLH